MFAAVQQMKTFVKYTRQSTRVHTQKPKQVRGEGILCVSVLNCITYQRTRKHIFFTKQCYPANGKIKNIIILTLRELYLIYVLFAHSNDLFNIQN